MAGELLAGQPKRVQQLRNGRVCHRAALGKSPRLRIIFSLMSILTPKILASISTLASPALNNLDPPLTFLVHQAMLHNTRLNVLTHHNVTPLPSAPPPTSVRDNHAPTTCLPATRLHQLHSPTIVSHVHHNVCQFPLFKSHYSPPLSFNQLPNLLKPIHPSFQFTSTHLALTYLVVISSSLSLFTSIPFRRAFSAVSR